MFFFFRGARMRPPRKKKKKNKKQKTPHDKTDVSKLTFDNARGMPGELAHAGASGSYRPRLAMGWVIDFAIFRK